MYKMTDNYNKEHCCKVYLGGIVLMLLWLAGCTRVDGKVPDQEAVLAYVEQTVPAESYELLSTEQVGFRPDNMEYTFRTQRGLEFKANSTLSPISVDATETAFYHTQITCDYPRRVTGLYKGEILGLLEKDPAYEAKSGWYGLLEYKDIEAASDLMAQASGIYAQELGYNNEEFLQANPVSTVHFVWYPNEQAAAGHTEWVNLINLDIAGQTDPAYYREVLKAAYVRCYVDGKIENRGDVPDEILAQFGEKLPH